ncbi:MAG: hypothetical protein R6U65_04895, partial [Perlabentimonas sp.]
MVLWLLLLTFSFDEKVTKNQGETMLPPALQNRKPHWRRKRFGTQLANYLFQVYMGFQGFLILFAFHQSVPNRTQ